MRAFSSSPAPSLPSRFARRFAARFWRARRGAVAIEFAFLMLPFLLLIFAVLEVALLFLVSASLDTAMETASRKIRTGAFQAAWAAKSDAERKDAFEDLVCKQVTWLIGDCRAKLEVDVVDLGPKDWTGINDPAKVAQPYDPATKFFNASSTQVRNTQARNIVLVRGWYRWPLLTPLLGQAVSSLPNGVVLITSTMAFRNEPYA